MYFFRLIFAFRYRFVHITHSNVNQCLLVWNGTQCIFIHLNIRCSPLIFVGGIGIVRYRKFYAFAYINNSQAINHLMQTFMAEIQNRLC